MVVSRAVERYSPVPGAKQKIRAIFPRLFLEIMISCSKVEIKDQTMKNPGNTPLSSLPLPSIVVSDFYSCVSQYFPVQHLSSQYLIWYVNAHLIYSRRTEGARIRKDYKKLKKTGRGSNRYKLARKVVEMCEAAREDMRGL